MVNPYLHLEGKKVVVRFMGVNGNWTESQKQKYAETACGVLLTEGMQHMIHVGSDVIGVANILNVEVV